MSTVTVADAKARLSDLLAQIEAGEDVVITRSGQPVARLSQVEKPKEAVKSLAESRARMPRWSKPSADLLRETRAESLCICILTPASSRHSSSRKPRAKQLGPSSPHCHRSNSASAGISSAHRCYDCAHDRLVYLSCSGARPGTRQRCMALPWHSGAGGRFVRES